MEQEHVVEQMELAPPEVTEQGPLREEVTSLDTSLDQAPKASQAPLAPQVPPWKENVVEQMELAPHEVTPLEEQEQEQVARVALLEEQVARVAPLEEQVAPQVKQASQPLDL